MDKALLTQIYDAHGGLERWRQVESIQININIFGPILITRFKSPWLSNITATIFTEKPYVSLHNFPEQGLTSIFDGYDAYIYDANDQITAERHFKNPSTLHNKPRLHWDHLDLVHSLGFGLWNTICSPFLLDHQNIETIQGDDLVDNQGRRLLTLNIHLPASIPCQSQHQVYYFNAQGLLERNDYQNSTFCPLAMGTHIYQQHRNVDGLIFATRRKVFPRLWNGTAIKAAKLMDAQINNISINWKIAIS
jgi:hypothetical protein